MLMISNSRPKKRPSEGKRDREGTSERKKANKHSNRPLSAQEHAEQAALEASLFGVSKIPVTTTSVSKGKSKQANAEQQDDEDHFVAGPAGSNVKLGSRREMLEQEEMGEMDDDELFVIDGGDNNDANVLPGSGASASSASEKEKIMSDSEESGNESVDYEMDDGMSGQEKVENAEVDALKDESHVDDAKVGTNASLDGHAQRRRFKSVWRDPDDATLQIPLAGPSARAADGTFVGTKRLRRLRKSADEMSVDGIEYERRLREMFEKLHPKPVWAMRMFRKPAARQTEIEKTTAETPTNGLEIQEQSGPSLADLLSQEDTGLLRQLKSKTKATLAPGTIEIERLRNANEAQPLSDEAAIESLAFHPSSRTSILMTASRDRRLRLFSITGGNSNPLLQTLHIPDMPVKTAMFISGAGSAEWSTASSSSVLISGQRPYLYAWDLQSGKVMRSNPWRGGAVSGSADGGDRDLSLATPQPAHTGGSLVAFRGRAGIVHLADWGRSGGSSSSIIASLRTSGTLAGLAWDRSYDRSPDGRTLVTLSTGGEFGIWDTRNLRAEVVKRDHGIFGAQGLECSPDGSSWLVGSENGIVSRYDGSDLLSNPGSVDFNTASAAADDAGLKVIRGKSDGAISIAASKTLENLTTALTTMRFNPDGQVMAMASRNKKDAMRLVHFPSMRVFSNWPTSGTPLGHVTGVDFSPSCRFVAIGNSRGKVLLYNLRHYA
ncbi:WD40 repeat-like protein [Tilletiaria anomala UBC 951]|uniref:WD40 repeat-like protein n=1 Tax=Tilletiaria anomala (strain ATCC 24038 / CBS 436.72 / UBC 951) TaxID=1037660 RepID=A0A066WPH7_TILAU|nr:WD40 repeat-like protein [Tilletiaria anomala UBC 951]KDN52530.1 WD40 repeat-like protein [Tilletiaria anomala UBC 951]